MKLRSLLFVPGDRPERFEKAAASGADALILDLEDAVDEAQKPFARVSIANWLAAPRLVRSFVRINPLDTIHAAADLAAILPARPDGIILPKAEGAQSIDALTAMADLGGIPILPITCETPGAIFGLSSYIGLAHRLAGLTWGAEDLHVAIGATTAREGAHLIPPLDIARNFMLLAAHAAGVPAIETVYPNIQAVDSLTEYVARARRDGFTGMMAIHPAQVPIINAGFQPSAAEAADAQAIVDAFAANPGSGALRLAGRMIDRPHLRRAQHLLTLADQT